jgi:ATP-dependent helicase/nuclease subunit A
MSSYTPEQRRAIASDANLVVTAGAGAGKTRVLTQRWIRLLMDPTREIDQVVAITFTKKAAGEMLERCRKELRALAAGGNSRAAALLERLDEARIKTFHSFCQSLLALYPVEAGLDPEVRLADDLEAGLLLSEAVDECLTGVAHGGDEAVIDLFTRFGRTRLAAHLARLIVQMRNLGESPSTLREATVAAAAQLSDPAPLVAAVGEAVAALLAYPTKPGNKGHEQQEQLRRTWTALAPRLTDLTAADTPALVDELRAVADGINASAVKPKKPLVDAIDAFAAAGTTEEAARVALAVLDLMVQCLQRYQARKEQANLLDFSDLVERLGQLLAASPAVRAELAEQHLIFLNDEVQDTDPSQWAVVRQMLTSPGEEEIPPGRVFIVGDPKQSIYRFRGARVEIFDRVTREVAPAVANQVSLMQNFRSQAGLIRLINALFDYAPMAWHRPERERAAELLLSASSGMEGRREEAVQIAGRIKEMVADGELLIWEAASPGAPEQARAARYGDVTILLQAMTHASLYAGALAAAGIPYYVVAGDGFFQAQEILDVENLLRVLDDPADGIALAGWLRSPHVGLSDNALAAMGLHPQGFLGAWSDSAFQATGLDRAVLERTRRLMPRLWQLAWQEPLPRLLPELYAELNLFPVLLAGQAGEAAIANLEKLAAKVNDFAGQGRHQFPDLLRWLRSAREAEAREGTAATEEEGGNSVRIMTVHKSKGLEFPVVVLPDIGRSQRSDAPEILLHPQVGLAPRLLDEAGEEVRTGLRDRALDLNQQESEAEFRRLFYVAVTRARDYLVLSAVQPKPAAEGNAPATWLHWLFAACGADVAAPPPVLTCGGIALPVRVADTAIMTPEAAVREIAAGAPLSGAPDRSANMAGQLSPEAEAVLRHAGPLTGEQPGDGLQTSASRLMVCQDCPRKYYLQSVLGLPDLKRVPTGWDALIRDPAEAEDVARESVIEPTVRGSIVHTVCERLNDPAELERLLTQAVQAYEIDPNHPDVEKALREPLRRYVQSDFFRRIQAAREVHSELPFRLAAGGMMLEGFIDKVLVEADGAVVVDFKTNQVQTPQQIDKAAEHYRLQMQIYALAVQERLGRPVKEMILYFLTPGEARVGTPDESGLRAQLAEMGAHLRTVSAWTEFPPRVAHCSQCQYQDFCREQLS